MNHFNRRKRTPLDRRKKHSVSTVASQPAVTAAEAIEEKAGEVIEEVIEEVPAEEEVKYEEQEPEEEAVEEGEASGPDMNVLSKAGRKAYRKIQKLEELDRLASIPTASILQTLFRPSRAMERLSQSDAPTLSQFACVFLNLFKWIAFGFVPAALMGRLINSDPLTYGHMNFTDQGVMALIIGLFMTFAEYYLHLAYYVFHRIIKEDASLRSMISVHARGALQLGVLYMLAALFLKGSLWIGTAMWFGVAMYAMMLKGYAFDLTLKIPKTMQLVVFLVVMFVLVLCSGVFFQLALKGPAEVLSSLLKI